MTVTGTTESHKVKKKKKPNVYWTEETEQAVVDYLFLDTYFIERKISKYLESRGELHETIDDGNYADLMNKLEISNRPETQKKKEKIFKRKIEKPLYKLVENIIFTYKLFSYDIDVRTLQKLCVTHLYLKFANFDPDNGAKSFSYYGTIAKHYLQNRKKDLDDGKSVNLNWDDYKDEAEKQKPYELDDVNEADDIMEFFEFISEHFESEVDLKKDVHDVQKEIDIKTENDTKVINAILEVFENPEMFEEYDYNKSSVRDYIEKKVKLNKKDLASSLGRIKNSYELKKMEFNRKKKE